MYKIFRRSYSRQLRALCALFIVGSCSVSVSAQGFKDSLLLKFFGTEAAVDKWRNSQENTYSFDHLLQGPKVAKTFKNKKFGDHFFLEGGTNLFVDMTRGTNASFSDMRPWAHLAFGDWATPFHGWRLSLQGGQYEKEGKDSKIFGGAVDYLLNINAVASEKYEKRKRLEFYGVAGVDWYFSKMDEIRNNTFGLHLGLRAQAYLSPYTYIYIEPRLGAYSKDLVHANTWHKYSLASTTLAGLGYALLPADLRQHTYETSGSFLDNTFFSLSGGPMAMVNLGGVSDLSQQMGGAAYLHLGKWFNPYSALRLGVGASSCKQPYDNKVKALSFGAGYMWNMHNTFGGYNPDRRYWMNAVADAKVNLSSSGYGKKTSWGVGFGLQPNVRIAKGFDLFLEPRVDLNTKEYASGQGSIEDFDVAVSLLAGIAFRQGVNTKTQLRRTETFENKTPYDHLFIDLGVGGFLPLTKGMGDDAFEHLSQGGYIGIGKWFNAASGIRLWSDYAKLEDTNSSKFKVADVGIDYLWNITNTLHGYNPERTFDLVASLGLNGMAKLDGRSFHVGGNFGIKGLAHLNKFMGLYVEPQVRIYGSDVLPNSSFISEKTDVLAALMAGVEITMNGYEPAVNMPKFYDSDHKGFFSYALGLGTTADAPSDSRNMGVAGRFSYGQWKNPVSAWRANLNGFVKHREPYRYAMLTAGADYMVDFTTLAYGFNPDRSVSLRGIAGANIGMDIQSGLSDRVNFVSDIHLGTQLAVAVGSKNELFVEPQASYIIGGKTVAEKEQRILGTVMLGLNHKVNAFGSKQNGDNSDFESETAYDHMFVDLGVGAALPIANYVRSDLSSQMGPSIYAGIGKWFNATSGLRLWSDMGIFKDTDTKRIDAIDFGLDYMLNLTNTFRGYNPQRRFEVVAAAGVTGFSQLESGKLYVGGNFGLKGLWHVNNLLSLYVEPQARIYGDDALPASSFIFKNTDVMGSLMAGVQFTMNGYRPSHNMDEFEENGRNSFFSVAAGMGTTVNALRLSENYGFLGRMSYGSWYTPISAWRINLNGFAKPQRPFRYVQMSTGVDYMSDLTALSYGYNPDRTVSVRAIGGLNIGADYQPHTTQKLYFMGDVHFGGQLAVAVGGKNEIYVEPQLAYRIGGCPTYNNNERVEPQFLFGLNHKLHSYQRKNVSDVDADHNDFVSVSMGTGFHSQTIASSRKVREKLTIDFDMSYGHWFNSISGLRLGMSTSSAKLYSGMKRLNMLSFHGDYMFNMLNLSGNDTYKDTDWVFNGMVGVNMNIGCSKKLDTTYAIGAQLGVEVGYKVTPEWEIFAEPTGMLINKNILEDNPQPAVVQGRLMLGTKYIF